MIENIHRIQEEARSQLSQASDSDSLEKLRVHYLGKKGQITVLLHQLKDLDPEKRREMGALLNKIRTEFENEIESRTQQIARSHIEQTLAQAPQIDVTLPGQYAVELGSLHPITHVLDDITAILRRIGFSIFTGPEIELEFYNFEALNTPPDHPARDLHDTFYIQSPVLLRSHTSPIQIRGMRAKKPPIQGISVGKVYRADYDITHTPMFHQIEGFMVGESVSLADLKGILHYLVKNLFGPRNLRFRPSYFPFTEPSAEVDMQCIGCKGNGRECRLCKSTGWLEIAGSGMIHPNVLKAVDYDPDQLSGFAFGLGVERITLLKYGMDDLRSLYENDYRMLEQF